MVQLEPPKKTGAKSANFPAGKRSNFCGVTHNYSAHGIKFVSQAGIIELVTRKAVLGI